MRRLIAALLVVGLVLPGLAVRWEPVWLRQFPGESRSVNGLSPVPLLCTDRNGYVYLAATLSSNDVCLAPQPCLSGPTSYIACFDTKGDCVALTNLQSAPLGLASGSHSVSVLLTDFTVVSFCPTGVVSTFTAANVIRAGPLFQTPQFALDASDKAYFACVHDAYFSRLGVPPGTNNFVPPFHAFVARYGRDGSMEKVLTLGSNIASIFNLGVDSKKRIYVSGAFPINGFSGFDTGPTVLGSGISAHVFTNAGANRTFIACFAEDGPLNWFHETTGATLTGIDVGPDGDVVAAGEFRRAVPSLPVTDEGPLFSTDGVLVRFDAAGEFKTGGTLAGTGGEAWRRVASARDGRAFTVGNIGSGNATNAFLRGNGREIVLNVEAFQPGFAFPHFVFAEYSADGTILSATNGGSPFGQSGLGVAVAADNDPVIVCAFQNSASVFGRMLTAANTNASANFFIAKLHKVPAIEAAQVSAQGTELTVSGPAGTTFVVEHSPDLLQWEPVATNRFEDTEFLLAYPRRSGAAFYRLKVP